MVDRYLVDRAHLWIQLSSMSAFLSKNFIELGGKRTIGLSIIAAVDHFHLQIKNRSDETKAFKQVNSHKTRNEIYVGEL